MSDDTQYAHGFGGMNADTKIHPNCKAQSSLAPARGSASALPAPISYDEWIALGPDKAAEYTAARLGLDFHRKRKLEAILNRFWKMKTPNR